MKLLMTLHLTNLTTDGTDRTREGVFQSDVLILSRNSEEEQICNLNYSIANKCKDSDIDVFGNRLTASVV
jgi:hypothetical protein